MLKHLVFSVILFAFISLCSCSSHQQAGPAAEAPAKTGTKNVAYKWGKVALKATANDTRNFKPRPTITSRYLGLIFTAVFDAWSRFDEKAIPVYLKKGERLPQQMHTESNKEKAISYAAYHALSEYYFSDSLMFKSFMKDLGYDPEFISTDPKTPEGIGYLAARAVIEARKNDGSNQYATRDGSNGKAYFDYTRYEPVNSPDENVDGNRWQPKYFSDGKGGSFAPTCLTPYWQHVEPIALDSASQFRPGPPPMLGSKQLEQEVQEVIDLQANLKPEEKALVEFMRDGPASVQQAGHWLIFAQNVSVRDSHTLDEDVKMYFLTETTAMDAFIASWDSKMYYDYARPFALVHIYHENDTIYGWKGEGKGWGKMLGKEWRPYSPSIFLCPPFPSYTSGHSTISGACSKALELYTGSDVFGESVKLVPGIMTEPDNISDTVTLEFPTFSKTAEMAGISRVMGGYHIQADNVAGLQLGRDVAQKCYDFYQEHIGEKSLKRQLATKMISALLFLWNSLKILIRFQHRG